VGVEVPILSDEQLDAAIEAEVIGAITLDTSIIDKFGRDFGHPMLRNLSQFERIDVDVVFSDIVAREVQSHIERDAAQSLVEMKKALAQHRKAWQLDETLDQLGESAKLSGDASDLARKRWKKFVTDIKGRELATADTLPVHALLDGYFNTKPPFEKEGKKKAEFPDPIALLSLEEWARQKDTKVLAVSSDGGWKAFAETSDYIIIVEDIAKLFGHFNRSANFIAQRIESLVQHGKVHNFERQIKALIEEHFDDSSIEIEADSHLGFESEFAGVDVLEVKFMPGFQVIASDEDSIDIALEFTCRIRFKAEFSWFVWDGVDREYMPMGSDIVSREESNAFVEIVGKFSREFDDIPDILKLEGSVLPDVPEFGTVEPHWDDN
jgi:hypothetical protein